MIVDINQYINKDIIKKIKNEIQNVSDQEIYLTGKISNKSEKVDEINVLARGNKKMVPAIISDLAPGSIVIHNHPSGNLTPSAADIRIASRIGNQGIGFAIINNQVSDIYVVVEPKIPEKIELLDKEKITSLFAPQGKLSNNLENYEYREQQLEVVKRVIESFNNNKPFFIEAGTGTGKSFAYLIPALYWSHQNNQPVVVSTNTINLQEQFKFIKSKIREN